MKYLTIILLIAVFMFSSAFFSKQEAPEFIEVTGYCKTIYIKIGDYVHVYSEEDNYEGVRTFSPGMVMKMTDKKYRKYLDYAGKTE